MAHELDVRRQARRHAHANDDPDDEGEREFPGGSGGVHGRTSFGEGDGAVGGASVAGGAV